MLFRADGWGGPIGERRLDGRRYSGVFFRLVQKRGQRRLLLSSRGHLHRTIPATLETAREVARNAGSVGAGEDSKVDSIYFLRTTARAQ